MTAPSSIDAAHFLYERLAQGETWGIRRGGRGHPRRRPAKLQADKG